MISAFFNSTELGDSPIITSKNVGMLFRLLKRVDFDYFDYNIIETYNPEYFDNNTKDITVCRYYWRLDGEVAKGISTISNDEALILSNEEIKFNYIENKK